jgi:uncharacterized protein YbaR (Trm112 family)
VTLDHRLLEILACPDDKGPLLYIESESVLYNPRLHRAYAVDGDIPVMLVDEADDVDDDEHARLMAVVAERGIQPTFVVD